MTSTDRVRWSDWLQRYDSKGTNLFGAPMLDAWNDREWEPNDADKTAAALLHTRLVSTISTQNLGYSEGVEEAALSSIYGLFEATRKICERHPSAYHLTDIAWHVLNVHVRPFTAKWHRRSEAGLLWGLDATDDFRTDLVNLQPLLRAFDRLLVEMRGGLPAATEPDAGTSWAAAEIQAPLPWGGGDLNREMADAEKDFIATRRHHYSVQDKNRAVGLALSGGGIRSATFSLGVLAALARRDILKQVDYLSTVSGGGYVGAFIAAFLENRAPAPGAEAPSDDISSDIGLRSHELPFRKAPSESAALCHIRQNSRFLAASAPLEKWQLALSQLSGLLLNLLTLGAVVATLAIVAYWLGQAGDPTWLAIYALIGIAGLLIILPLILKARSPRAEFWLAILGFGALLIPVWKVLSTLHGEFADYFHQTQMIAVATLGFPLVLLSVGVLGERVLQRWKKVPRVLTWLAMPLFVLAAYLTTYAVYTLNANAQTGIAIGVSLLTLYLLVFVDVNLTSLHRHYRRKLAGTFLIQSNASDRMKVDSVKELKLSELGVGGRAPYPLINAALNLPASRSPKMRGRLADFFCFAPRYCGSLITGFEPTPDWEVANKDLDLASATAISGAAASPYMGLRTSRPLSFWLALMNVRLSYWILRPGRNSLAGAWLLVRELFGLIHEDLPRLNLSDGGHIENLGVYELLRRRCKFIIAVDGEQDPRMTFHAITNLQRLAAIDFGATIDIDLDDLRLNGAGLSLSHFRFGRVHYADSGIGYLLYVKLSLTGNEGEFLRRYKLDEPDFPHHSTANQFFTESQFEAYRSLGEHVVEKLFLKAVLKELGGQQHVVIDEWFEKIADSFLEPPQ